jgi:hypothetical protein
MESHKQLFTRWSKEVRGERKAYGFKTWRSDQDLLQCEVCHQWGSLGEEVTYFGDTMISACGDCTVSVWGWAGKDGMALAVECPKGREVEFLTAQARSFGETGKVWEWGYEGKTICKREEA